jgi:peptidoglycan/LPS O-acetylase OafA/YrhL
MHRARRRKGWRRAALAVPLLACVALPAHGAETEDPYRSQQWSLDTIGAPEAWRLGRGAGTTVAVIDSGVDAGNADLAPRVDEGATCLATRGNALACTAGATDTNGRGTHAAGLVGAGAGDGVGVSGVAPDARILPVRVSGSGPVQVDDLAAALDWAVDHGAHVALLSAADGVLVGPPAPLLTDAVQRASEADVIVVVPAGVVTDAPALVVTSTNRNDRRSTSTPPVGPARWGLAAPGGEVPETQDGLLSTWLGGDYRRRTGTGPASALVAGAAALLRSTGYDDVVQRLLDSADDIGPSGRDVEYGAGRLNIASAVDEATRDGVAAAPNATPTTLPQTAPSADASAPNTADSAATGPSRATGARAASPTPVAQRFAPSGDGPAPPERALVRVGGWQLALLVAAAVVLFAVVAAHAPRPVVNDRHWASFDGLRGVAIILVLLLHLGFAAFRGGFLGVDLFFVLSGFLVTTMLLERRPHAGRLGAGIGRFYRRRLARIVPAMAAFLVAVIAWDYVQTDPALDLTPRAFLLAAGQVTNFAVAYQWAFMSALTPLWTLACEMQFYLVWPLVFLLLARLRLTMTERMLVCIALILAVAGWRAMAYSATDGWGRTYFALDTRADALLLGCAIAFAQGAGHLSSARAARILGWLGVAGVATLGVMVVWINERMPGMYTRGGFLAADVAAAAIVASLVASRGWFVGRALQCRPLADIGRLSYGLYLWHMPILLTFGTPRGNRAFEVRVGVLATSAIAAALSFVLIERWFLSSRRPATVRGGAATVGPLTPVAPSR